MLEALGEARAIDFVSMDVKAPLDVVSYRRSVGIPVDLTPLLKSVDVLRKGKVEYEFRMTVVPGLHCEEDILRLGSQLRAGRRFVLQNFNPENPLDPRLKSTPPYDPEVLKRMEKNVQAMS
jgi:pyruvate formate lyase activating enzyme